MSEILTKARELGQTIVDSEEYKHLKECEERQEKDEEAIALLMEYNNVRKALAEEIQGGVDDERMAKIREELTALYEKVMGNAVIAEYAEAQKNFDAVISQMNSILTYFITGELSAGCSGNCSGCSSCG